jgi:branched-chain amino acid transport system permease protein
VTKDAAPASAFWLLFRQPGLSRQEKCWLVVVLGGLALLAFMPVLVGSYGLSTVRDALILSVFALSLDYMWGRANVLSLGHALFFGLGAYGMAVATTKLSWGSAAGLALGVGTSAVLAFLVGYFLMYAGVRLHFFAIITIALSLIAGQIAVSWSSVTNGDVGILGVPGLRIHAGIPLDFTEETAIYYVAVVLLYLTMLVCWLAYRAPYGTLLRAIGMNEFRARTLGHNTSLHLLIVFVIAGSVAALAGGVYAAAAGVVAPDLFSVVVSIEVLVWVMMGGRGTIIGPVAATILVTRLQLELSSISTSLWPLVLGTIFVLQVVFFPEGFPAIIRFAGQAWPFRRRRPAQIA